MKPILVPLVIIGLACTSTPLCHAQNGTLRNEINGNPIDASNKKLFVLIHGWNPDNVADMYAGDPWSSLVYDIKQNLTGSDWSLFTFHWEQGSLGANTGPIYNFPQDGFNVQGVGNAVVAAVHADQQGHALANLLNQASANLRRIHLIAHSAGAWVAREAAADLLQRNPYLTVQLTLLDPFIPDVIPEQTTGLSTARMSQIASIVGQDRISLLENYYADDLLTYSPTWQTFSWRSVDINQVVGWLLLHYYSHSGPIEFYRDTAYGSMPGNPVPSGLYGLGCPFDYSQVGWERSLFYTDEIHSPRIAIQPQGQSVPIGSTVTLSVTASSSHTLTYQWFRDGQLVLDGTTAAYPLTVASTTTGSYVVKISYADQNGFVFSDPAAVTIAAPVQPVINAVYPTSLLTSPSPQPLQILGSGFTPTSTLLFNGTPSLSVPQVKSDSEIDYGVTVVSAGTWTVQVNNGQLSNVKTFTVTMPPPTTGTLVVNLSPASAVSAGAQWQVDGTGYNNSGQAVGYLTPGAHTVTFKPISGYATPANLPVGITAGQQETKDADYAIIAQTTYTLALNAANGQVTPSPSGWNGTAYVYASGSAVQLTANANFGYHFTGWGGDLSGTLNPTAINMTANKTITANFAAGDLNLGTIIVTLEPAGARGNGAKWKVNSSDWLASGDPFQTPLLGSGQNYVQFKDAPGWFTPVPRYITVAGGQTATPAITYAQDTTPGLLTVTLSPPEALVAGAHWHVNDGTSGNYGNGATHSLAPGPYSVTFDAVPGWTTPLSQPVTILPGQSVGFAGNYTSPAGQPVIGSISPAFGPMAGGTLLTLIGANFTAPATVLIGGQPASNVVISSSTRITCVAPPSTNYGTTNVILQTTSGNTTNVNGFSYGVTRGTGLDLTTSIGGRAYGVAVKLNYAYVGEGRNLLVIDISTPANPSKIARLQLPGIVESIAILGNYAYVADGDAGLQVVDITVPSSPQIRGFYPAISWTYGVAILGVSAYVVDSAGGLEILDLASRANPRLLSSTNCPGALDIVLKGSPTNVLAYVSTGSRLSVFDVSNALSPVLLSNTSIDSTDGAFSIALSSSGTRLFAASFFNGLQVIDVSNPTAPSNLGPISGISHAASVAVSGNLVYAIDSVDAWGFYAYSLVGNTLSMVGHLTGISSSGIRMAASGSSVVIAGGDSGLEIMDVSNPTAPAITSRFMDSGLFGFYYAAASFTHYIYTAGEGGLKVLDVADPGHPVVTFLNSSLGVGSYSRILFANGYAFVISSQGVNILNMSNPASPSPAGSIPQSVIYPFDAAIIGNYLLVAGVDTSGYVGKVVTFNISSPASPVQGGSLSLQGQSSYDPAIRISAVGNKAAVGLDSGLIKILDLSDISSPVQRGQVAVPSFRPGGLALSSSGSTAYALDHNGNGLYVIDANLNSPSVLTNLPADSAPGNTLETTPSELYAATSQGIYVFDTSIEQSPALKRSYRMSSTYGSRAIALPGVGSASGRLYVANSDGGVVGFSELDVEPPSIYITSPTFGPVWTNTTSTLANFAGGADDNVAVTEVTWSNNRGGSGLADGNWTVDAVPLYPGSNILTVTAYDAAGSSSSDTLTVIYQIAKQNQTIIFQPLADRTLSDPPVTLTAAASSGLPVAFATTNGNARITSSILTVLGAGSVTVQASQPGNDLFNPAPTNYVTFNIARANQSIDFRPITDKSTTEQAFQLTATASSGLPVSFSVISGPATLSTDNMLTVAAAGIVTVLAWQPGNSNYNAAPTLQQSFSVTKTPQTITFGSLSPQKVGDAPFPLSASTSSGLPVAFSISGPATLSGNIVTLTGYGTVTATASQSGNNVYAAASNISQSLSVLPADNTLVPVGFQSGSGFSLAFYGLVGSSYTFQASSNLSNWQTFAAFLMTNSPATLTDPTATNFPKRFYRVVKP